MNNVQLKFPPSPHDYIRTVPGCNIKLVVCSNFYRVFHLNQIMRYVGKLLYIRMVMSQRMSTKNVSF